TGRKPSGSCPLEGKGACDQRRKEAERHEHEHRKGSRLAGVEELELDSVHVEAQQLGRGPRSAAREDEDVVEDTQDIGESEEDDEHEQRSQVGEVDVTELRPPVRAVDLGGLDRLTRDGLQPGEEEEGHDRRALYEVTSITGEPG